MRYTPAGLPALDLTLEHESTVEQPGGTSRRVKVEIEALAIGVLAEPLAAQPIGAEGVFAGFLTARRNGRGILFHLTEFESRGHHATTPR